MSNQPDNSQPQRPRVLVIDDSTDVHRLLGVRLKTENLDLLFASDGPSGIEIAKQSDITVILLDLNMPGMDGFEVLRRLKDEPGTTNIPIIVLSGLASAQDKVTAFDLGAIDYITKPFDLMELKVRVRSAIRMATLLNMLSQRAQIDGLTGLWNRQYFDQRLEEEVQASIRHTRPLALALLDADHFKSVNDLYGHPAGDQVLEGISQVLRSQSRGSDVPCRYGGEEFAIIMPETTGPEAFVLCERIREEIAERTWPKHPERQITVSLGLCGSANGVGPADPAAWIEHADKCLYEAKNSGRNRVKMIDLAVEAHDLKRAG